MKKHAFTIMEILLTFTIIMVIAGASVPMVFKKNNLIKDSLHKTGTWKCSCDTEDPHCDFNADEIVKMGSEFFIIQMTGGGGAGGTEATGKGGSAGESRTIYYPAMQGNYRVVLGKGGSPETITNGGITALYKIEKDENNNDRFILLESVRGGVTNNETCQDVDKTCPRGETTCSENRKGCFGESSLFGKKNGGSPHYISNDERELVSFDVPVAYRLRPGVNSYKRTSFREEELQSCSGQCDLVQKSSGVFALNSRCDRSCAAYGRIENEKITGQIDFISAEEWILASQGISCGDGGDPTKSGKDGEVIISWE